MRLPKFLASGIIGISVNLGLFHALYVIGVPYLTGSVVSFAFALSVGFILQKYWTFEDRGRERLHAQFASYAALALFNLALNTGIVFMLVEKLSVYYLLAQAIGAALVAIDSFIAYQLFIFKPKQESGEVAKV